LLVDNIAGVTGSVKGKGGSFGLELSFWRTLFPLLVKKRR